MPSLRDRLAQLRARLRPDPRVPARVWMRRQWPGLLALVLLLAVVVVGDVWLATCGFERCPTSADIRAFRPSEGGKILDRRGQTLGRVRAVRRANVPLARVPLHVRQAFVATEDRRFFDHDGVDWRGVLRASAVNVRALGVREGFSTITMQLARNTFAVERQGERSMARKLLELRLSRLIEHSLTKEQILELYLNVIYLGNGVYGVEGASRDLFGRGIEKVTVAQAAMLAALPKGPSAYTPRRHPQRALRRRNLVLALMAREGYLTADAARAGVAERLVVPANEWRPDRADDSYALDAVRAIVDSVREALGIESNDLTVHTTLDLAAQRAAQRAVQRRADAIDDMTGRKDGVEGAMVALDPRSGDVRALVGGRRYERGNFNRVLRARRQPGSAFKPFVYAAALEAGMSPATEVDDVPVEVQIGRQVWAPRNFDDEYLGHTTLRRALMKSANAATVRVSRSLGEAKVVERARKNGIVSKIEPNPAIALGAAEVTPLELVSAYAPFANGGFRVVPRLVTRIAGVDGATLWTSEPSKVGVMDARDAYLLTSMLKSVVEEGTATAVRSAGVRDPVAGKTGTTNDGTDVWFVGYTPTLVAGFWFGYDEPRSMGRGASGGRLAAPAWAEFYAAGWKERGQDWQPPAGLVQRRIDAYNGQLAGEWCPVTRDEWFRAGTEPTERCAEHYAPEPEPVWQNLPPQIGEQVEEAAKKGGSKLKRALGKIFRW
ncbi:PBP1A family penicillin-binding protein [Roseisolibacter sp. H3M3-2]|uniref:penicillin-binding protein 1A n=1 Tax=Roseisolibacter sp. H3M3-2 TaxID=3031323 RepID=UPI0023D9C445|nr:PBP1A family penicillin-binding protein [Roseisolibacter sp. H3M3-2]MDF1503373.1 PBP1A family penicillin-binding protein [Roseisolibacter sp. H3M3-2]